MPHTKSPRILVVDDDLGVIASYRHVLEKEQYGIEFRDPQTVAALECELFGPSGRDTHAAPSWRVEFVDTGEDAVETVRSALAAGDPIDVVFLDIRLQDGLDGYDTARSIRDLDRKVQIVVVSAYSDYSEADLLEVAGPKERFSFLAKPVWPEQLRDKAVELCTRAHQRRKSRAIVST